MPFRQLISLFLFGMGLFIVQPLQAQALQHFESCPQNANNINNAQIFFSDDFHPALSETTTLEEDDEVALFTSDDVCAGAVRWEGAPESLTIYGEDEQFGMGGYAEEEALSVRVWDASEEVAYEVETSYKACGSDASAICQDDGRYYMDAFYTISDFTSARRISVDSTEFGAALDGEAYSLEPAAPNPFNLRTTYRLAVAQAQPVTAVVYNALGRRVAMLHDGRLEAETPHRFTLKAGNRPAGVYFIRITGSSFQTTQKVVLTR